MTQNLFCDNNSFQLFHYSLKIQISVILILAKISPPKKVKLRKISLSQFPIRIIAPVNQTYPTITNKLTGNSEINEPFRTKKKKKCKFSTQEYVLGFYTLYEPQCKILIRIDKSNSLLIKSFS